MTLNGITTVVGCIGTDGVARHMESLLAKAKGLEEEGITTYVYTGSYQVPVHTLTGSMMKDIMMLDKVIGAGKSPSQTTAPPSLPLRSLPASRRTPG